MTSYRDHVEMNKRIDGERLWEKAHRHYAAHVAASDPLDVRSDFDQADRTWPHGRDACCSGENLHWATNQGHSRIVNARVFLEYHTDLPVPTTADQALEYIRQAASHMVHSSLESARSVVFVTPSSEVQEHIMLRGGSIATIARDLLGLAYEEHAPLAILELPPGALTRLYAPTYIDGGTHDAYCSWENKGDSSGFTWRLDTQSKGVRELVTRDQVLDPRRANVQPLGKVAFSRNEPRYDAMIEARTMSSPEGRE